MELEEVRCLISTFVGVECRGGIYVGGYVGGLYM
jgi:hypothetical protein